MLCSGLIMLCIPFIACDSEDSSAPKEEAYITLSENDLSFFGDKNNANITILSNIEWSIFDIPSWLNVTPQRGKGENVVSVSANSIEDGESRTAMLIVRGGGVSKTISVAQIGKEKKKLSVSAESLYFDYSNSSKDVQLTADGRWTITSNAEWCKCDKSMGTNNARLRISVERNTSLSSRNAAITISTDYSSVEILIEQDKGTSLVVSPTSINVDCYGSDSWDDIVLSVQAVGQWEISSNEKWCSLNGMWDSGNSSMKLWVQPNETSELRTAIITVSQGEQKQEVVITQSAVVQPVLNISINKTTWNSFTYTLTYKAVGVKECGVCYSDSNTIPTLENSQHEIYYSWQTYNDVSKLPTERDYYVRGYITTSQGTYYSETIVVTISGAPGSEDNPTPHYIKRNK